VGSGSVPHRQTFNLIGGAIASSAADMSTTLLSDYRTGFLLRTSPRKQWIALAYGSMVAVFLAPRHIRAVHDRVSMHLQTG